MRPGCGKKLRHGSREAAENAMNDLAGLRKTRNQRFNVYLCVDCGHWHVGRARANPGKPRKVHR